MAPCEKDMTMPPPDFTEARNRLAEIWGWRPHEAYPARLPFEQSAPTAISPTGTPAGSTPSLELLRRQLLLERGSPTSSVGGER